MRNFRDLSLLALAILVGLWIEIAVAVFVSPRFTRVFDDFPYRLPAPTILELNFSRWLLGRLHPGQVLPGLAVVIPPLLALTVLAGYGCRRRGTLPATPQDMGDRLQMILGLGVIAFVIGVVGVVALFIPLITKPGPLT